jgi:hypothetical protein
MWPCTAAFMHSFDLDSDGMGLDLRQLASSSALTSKVGSISFPEMHQPSSALAAGANSTAPHLI